jgi:hypothetical protein
VQGRKSCAKRRAETSAQQSSLGGLFSASRFCERLHYCNKYSFVVIWPLL